jgi:ElaB/YqjD/DUF883 family membrane-anchored ribosome-binding protein
MEEMIYKRQVMSGEAWLGCAQAGTAQILKCSMQSCGQHVPTAHTWDLFALHYTLERHPVYFAHDIMVGPPEANAQQPLPPLPQVYKQQQTNQVIYGTTEKRHFEGVKVGACVGVLLGVWVCLGGRAGSGRAEGCLRQQRHQLHSRRPAVAGQHQQRACLTSRYRSRIVALGYRRRS